MYPTPAKRWACAIALDTFIIGGFITSLILGFQPGIDVIVFFTWFSSGLFLLLCAGLGFATLAMKHQIQEMELERKDYTAGQPYVAKLDGKIADLKKSLADMWSPLHKSMTDSKSYGVYHAVTDIILIATFVVSGFMALAVLRTFTYIGSTWLIGIARRNWRLTNGLPEDEDAAIKLQKELKLHRQAVVQQNNVCGGDFVAGDKVVNS